MNDDEGVMICVKCYRSMKKNEELYNFFVVFKCEREFCVDLFCCSCVVGQGFCYYIIGLMYMLVYYQMLGMKSVLLVIFKILRFQVRMGDYILDM